VSRPQNRRLSRREKHFLAPARRAQPGLVADGANRDRYFPCGAEDYRSREKYARRYNS
jgi:hypothetical protein